MYVCVVEGGQVRRENKHYTRDLKFQLVNERWHNELGVASLLLDMVMWMVLIASEWGSFALIRVSVIVYQGILGLKYICKKWISISTSKEPTAYMGRSQ